MSELLRLARDTQQEARKNIVTTMKTISSRMGNTPAICRKCYVHPALLDAYMTGSLTAGFARRRAGLNREEAAFLGFLHGLRQSTRRRRHPAGRFVAPAPRKDLAMQAAA